MVGSWDSLPTIRAWRVSDRAKCESGAASGYRRAPASRYTGNPAFRGRDDLEVEIKTGTPNEEALAQYLTKYEIRAINPNSYINVFYDAPSFTIRTAPAIKSYSLFDEE